MDQIAISLLPDSLIGAGVDDVHIVINGKPVNKLTFFGEMRMSLDQLTRDYLQKLAAHDVPGCLAYYEESSTVEGRNGVHRGLDAIKMWHQERVDAAFALVSLQSVSEKGADVTADLVVTSNRLAGRRMEELPMRLILRFSDGKIRTAKLSLRIGAGLKSLFGR